LLIQCRFLAEGAGNCRCSYKAGKKVRHSIHKNSPRKTKRSALARTQCHQFPFQYGQLSLLHKSTPALVTPPGEGVHQVFSVPFFSAKSLN
jgi:hypothetical protein